MAVEIERKFLLKRLPPLPPGTETWRIEQGYLPDPPGPASDPPRLTEGRLRRAAGPGGTVVCTHTIKEGQGIARLEMERSITPAEFEEGWPRTVGRRLRKTRHRVESNGRVWEIDDYPDLGMVLAEVELPSVDAPLRIPAWLAPHVEREVTDDPRYTNYRLALRSPAST